MGEAAGAAIAKLWLYRLVPLILFPFNRSRYSTVLFFSTLSRIQQVAIDICLLENGVFYGGIRCLKLVRMSVLSCRCEQ